MLIPILCVSQKVRAVISDFAVFITILTMVLTDYALGIPSTKLQVPNEFKVSCITVLQYCVIFICRFSHKSILRIWICNWSHDLSQPTRDDRGWFISPLGPNPWWTTIVTFIPALLCTILIFMDQQITAVIINRKEHKLKVCHYFTICSFWLTNNLVHLMRCLSLCMCASTERLWVSSGPVCGGCDAGRVLSHGPPVVRGCDGAVNQPCEQPEIGVWMLSTWWTAQVLGHQRAALHRPHDIRPYGKLSIYDFRTEGQWSSIDQQMIVANFHC